MILCLKTNDPKTIVELYATTSELLDSYSWAAERNLAHDLLSVIRDRLVSKGAEWKDLTGIILFQGPGSFTGLRIGATTANTLAHAQQIPIVGVSGDKWVQDGMRRLDNKENDKIVLPKYGSEANITQAKK